MRCWPSELIWLNKSPQSVPVTGPFLSQIPPLEGDLSEVFRSNELRYFQTGNRCPRLGGEGLASGSVVMSVHPAQTLRSQHLVGIAW